jgi:RNA polymerase sigma-70 factor (ECF subfamily)
MGFNLPDLNTEDRLVARMHQGDPNAVTEIYDIYFPPLYQYIRLQVGEAQAAEDIASEVFFRLMATIGKNSGPQKSLRGWLFQVARNLVYRHFKAQRHYPKSALEEWFSADVDVEMQVLRSVEVEKAQRALTMLAPDQREVLILRFVEALDLEETASIMGRSVSAIKSLQFRAVRTLRTILGELSTGVAS